MGDMIKDMPRYVDLAYRIDMDEWNGSRRLQIIVQDVREAAE
jgi:hypothetical protein